MALMIARPWKRPKTGIYWLRKYAPDDLLKVVGKREEKQSLRTGGTGLVSTASGETIDAASQASRACRQYIFVRNLRDYEDDNFGRRFV